MQQIIVKFTDQYYNGFSILKLDEQSKQNDVTIFYTKTNINMLASTEYIIEKNNKTSYAAYYKEEDNMHISFKAFLAIPSAIKNAKAHVKINYGASTVDFVRHDLLINDNMVASYTKYKKE